MARILIGWELGGGHGHVVNMVAIGRALRDRGHEVLLAVKDTAGTWPVLRDAGFRVMQAPLARPQPPPAGARPFMARSFADILAVHGFADIDRLEPHARAWQALLDVARPDLVLAEYSPTLSMVSHGRVPCVAFGIGFCVPCLDGARFPELEPAGTEVASNERIAQTVSDAMRRLGLVAPGNPLSALLGVDQLDLGISVIDPYSAARAEPSVGPLWTLPGELPPVPPSPACLLYLPGEHPLMPQIIEGLGNLGMPGVAYVRGAGRKVTEGLVRAGFDVSPKPLQIDAVLSQVSVVVHHGGTGTVLRALAAGRPQVVAAMVLEQGLTARMLRKAGVALEVGPDGPARQLSRLVRKAASDQALMGRARELAASLKRDYPVGSLDTVVGRVLSRLPRD